MEGSLFLGSSIKELYYYKLSQCFLYSCRKWKSFYSDKSLIMNGRRTPEIFTTGTHYRHWLLIQSQAAKFGSRNQTCITTHITRNHPCLMASRFPITCTQLTQLTETEVKSTRKSLSTSGQQDGGMRLDFLGGKEMS